MMGQKTFTANKSIRRLFSGVLRLVRSTSLVVGLAVMMALMVGVASSALAGTGIGGVFNLGKTNSVNAVTKLAGSVPGASLVVDNNSTGSAATALDLQVEPGKAPMKVNSGTKVANLNSDTLDGIDSAAFGRVAKSSSPPGLDLTSEDQSIATANITPGTPSGYITANAHILVSSSGLTSPTNVRAALYVPEDKQYLDAWQAIETISPGTQYTNLAITGAVPVASAGAKTVELRVRRDVAGSGTINAKADLVATYFPFNGAGG